ncbi:hypothetical protein BpHYR1_000580 [Brachionus plicatilis]|uniref:Uncharacterized protein n=1 Tax=Brachionus plicatilis TaxID=10195 RepID=A0A3M7T464_BRAPC|nr:hypothetical protein BpHYR1_000580 [Brachionus plicatilis]
MKYSTLIIAVLVLACAEESVAFLNLIKLAGKKDNCQRVVQSGNYRCSRNERDCRACCHFDLSTMNERYGEREFFLKEALVLQASGECVCLICKNYLQDFANKPYF